MKKVKCFSEETARTGAYATLAAEPRVIEVARITGTVDKCGELDSRFRLLGRRRDRGERFRRLQLSQTNLAYTNLPPIDVYLLAGEYYVVDGNRRVEAARRQGLEYLAAHVTECIPLADRAAQPAAVSRRQFEQETGLRSVPLTYESGYAALLEEVRRFNPAAGEDFRRRARRWHSTFFLPACRQLKRSSLARSSPRARPGDLFVMVSRFYQEQLGGYPPDISFRTLLSGFLLARGQPVRGPVTRLPPFRLLLAALGGGKAR